MLQVNTLSKLVPPVNGTKTYLTHLHFNLGLISTSLLCVCPQTPSLSPQKDGAARRDPKYIKTTQLGHKVYGKHTTSRNH